MNCKNQYALANNRLALLVKHSEKIKTGSETNILTCNNDMFWKQENSWEKVHSKNEEKIVYMVIFTCDLMFVLIRLRLVSLLHPQKNY